MTTVREKQRAMQMERRSSLAGESRLAGTFAKEECCLWAFGNLWVLPIEWET